MKHKIDIWANNQDYATFLPSISTFYNNIVSKDQNAPGVSVPKERLPKEFETGVEGLNFLNKQDGYFHYPYALYSAGHAQLDTAKSDIEESMVQKRDRKNTFILGDSGGFQIAKGIIKFDWEHFLEQPGDKGYIGSADKTRGAILNWLEHTADYSMVLDIPTWAATSPVLSQRTGLKTFRECLDGTMHNNAWFLANRQNKTKFLNVLQGSNNADADTWYDNVKHFPFEGWAMGGNNMRDAHLLLRRLITMRDEGMLSEGKDVIHVLGTSKLEWAVFLTAIQRALRKHVNPKMMVTYDCASPFIATAYGLTYTQHIHQNTRFMYLMEKAVDSRELSGSNIPWPWGSPIGDRVSMGDICYYKPGQQNKNGKVSRTSWDTFSYSMIMAHNVYQHIESIQRANALADVAWKLNRPDPTKWLRAQKQRSQEGQVDLWVPRNVLYMMELVDQLFTSQNPMELLRKCAPLLEEFSNANQPLSNDEVSSLFTTGNSESSITSAGPGQFTDPDDEKLMSLESQVKDEN